MNPVATVSQDKWRRNADTAATPGHGCCHTWLVCARIGRSGTSACIVPSERSCVICIVITFRGFWVRCFAPRQSGGVSRWIVTGIRWPGVRRSGPRKGCCIVSTITARIGRW